MKRIAFLDRDGVINKKPPAHMYVMHRRDFVFNPGIFELLLDLKNLEYEIIVITNQRGIARGMFFEKDLHDIHDFMVAEFRARNIPILDIFYCPHENNSCTCRKPEPGLLEMAHDKYPIDTKNSLLISDSPEDVIMGEKFGIGRNYLVEIDHPGITI